MKINRRKNRKAGPAIFRPAALSCDFGGEAGRRLEAVTRQWLIPAPMANPGMLAMFRERESVPPRDMMPWAGEFAGKHLTCATQILRITGDAELHKSLQMLVDELVSAQAEDGYLGPFPEKWRLKKGNPACPEPWDAWGHYHIMFGLLMWYELAGDGAALRCARRIGDLLVERFLRGGERLHDTGSHEMNQAPVHSLAKLHRITGQEEYLDLALRIVDEFSIPPAGDYYRQGLRNTKFHRTPKPRWESLHPIMGLVELHYATGDEKYRRAFENLWWTMLEGDRHNNGGFTSGEKATGNPYQTGAIETCCTVAWMAMTVEMLRLTGNPIVADELEISFLNSGFGMMNPSGRWFTYDTPMDGRRWASAHSCAFQARPGTPELNCCSVNGPRVLGLLGEWALLQAEDGGIRLNYYGPGTFEVAVPGGRRCRLRQNTDYPRSPDVEISVGLDAPASFELALRIPAWSHQASVIINGKSAGRALPGTYFPIRRTWKNGDIIRIVFDFRPRYWVQGPGYFYEDWEANWRVFGPAYVDEGAERLAILEACRKMPDKLRIGGKNIGHTVLPSRGGRLDLMAALHPQGRYDTAFCFAEIESPCEAVLPIRFTAGWWSIITVNGKKVFDDQSTQYEDATLRVHRAELPLKKGSNLVGWAVTRYFYHFNWNLSAGISKPMSASDLRGDRSEFQLASIYRGPVLLAFDHRFNRGIDAEHIPGLDARGLDFKIRKGDPGKLEPWMLLDCRDAQGNALVLCDFASAGVTGNPYRSWFNVRGVRPAKFARKNPTRTSLVTGADRK